MLRWRLPEAAELAPPGIALALLERAIAARPDSAMLRLKLANLSLDRYDFVSAAMALETALQHDPHLPGARVRLAHCYNGLNRPRDAVALLEAQEQPEFERARALAALGLANDAEHEFRAVLTTDPHCRPALRHISKLLRRAGRTAELLALCEDLHAHGAGNPMLLYAWGTALALDGQHERASVLLMDRARIAELALPVPEGFADIAEFNAALADEILCNSHRLSEFPAEDEANRGSSRVHALFAGRRPELISALLQALQKRAEAWMPPRYGAFDPWIDARPQAAHLKAWGLIQRGGEYEEWHLHPGGWLSGVYYVRVPKSVSSGGTGPGCIEFGPPSALAKARPGYWPIWRHAPREGFLLFAPSHYAHRTIPSGIDEYRISFAFDVVPHRGASDGGQAAAEELLAEPL